MSIRIVKEEIARFLESDASEVLAIRGKWGIGKTFAWKQILKDQKSLNKVKLGRYSYVSLFGVTSLQDLKEALFQNMVSGNLIGEKLDVYTCSTHIKDSIETFGRKSSKAISDAISKFSKYTTSLSTITSFLSFITVRDSIICIDDFERKGDKLSLKEILGLISQLKEERNCKIVLIYNDEYLEKEKAVYDELKEKVIDAEILYSPSPEESINIVFYDEENISKTIRNCAKKLSITNIRILTKIKRLALILKKLLHNHDPKILDQAIQTATLSCWACYSKSEEIPDHEWIKKYNAATSFMVTENDKEHKTKESKWCDILQDYGYVNTDKFDLVIHEGVTSGYFNSERLFLEAENLTKQYSTDHDNSYKKAWELFHNDLSDNQDNFINAVYEGFIQNQMFLSAIDLHSTVITLRKLGRNDLANKLIDSFVEARKSDIEIFDLSNLYYTNQLSDQDLIAKFTSVYQTFQKPKSLNDVLQRIVDTQSWMQDDVPYLNTISESEYIAYFKSLSNPFLRRCIQRIKMLSINNAIQALISIAKESPINALRLENNGIKINET